MPTVALHVARFQDPLFDAQWLRAAGHRSYGGAEVVECFAAARRIKEPDAQSWFDAWYFFAEAVFAEANKSRAGGRPVSALGGYLRASNYFRAAYTFLFEALIDSRLVDAYWRHRSAFENAVDLMTPSAKRITIPFGDGELHGYLFRAANKNVWRPTLILNGGYDTLQRRPTCLAVRRQSLAATHASHSMGRVRERR